MGDKVIHLGVVKGLADPVALRRQRVDVAHFLGKTLQGGGVVQGFKALECGEHIRRADTYAVVFQNCNIAATGENCADTVTQGIAAGHIVNGDLHVGANLPHRGDQVQIGAAAHDGKSHQRRGMGVEHSL